MTSEPRRPSSMSFGSLVGAGWTNTGHSISPTISLSITNETTYMPVSSNSPSPTRSRSSVRSVEVHALGDRTGPDLPGPVHHEGQGPARDAKEVDAVRSPFALRVVDPLVHDAGGDELSDGHRAERISEVIGRGAGPARSGRTDGGSSSSGSEGSDSSERVRASYRRPMVEW